VSEIKTALFRLSDAVTKLALVQARQIQANHAIERIENRFALMQ
jgi:hypothetical protein